MKTTAILGTLLSFLLLSPLSSAGNPDQPLKRDGFTVYPFGSGGQLKMIYDRRQRPQAIYVDDLCMFRAIVRPLPVLRLRIA